MAKQPKYDFEYSSLSIGIIITAASVRGANRILKNTAKDPDKFTLLRAINSNGDEVDLETVK